MNVSRSSVFLIAGATACLISVAALFPSDATAGRLRTFYLDGDGDGYGDPSKYVEVVKAPPGYVSDGTDCNDSDPAVKPGVAEICGDGVDNNCSGVADEQCGASGGDGKTYWYWDSDGDGFGDPSVRVYRSRQPGGYVANATDCNDSRQDTHPSAFDPCGDDVDQNCDGSDPGCLTFEGGYGTDADEIACAGQQTADGGYVMFGSSQYYGSYADAMLMRIDANGTLLWRRQYDLDGPDWVRDVTQTVDGGFAFLADPEPGSVPGDRYVLLTKVDAGGNPEWSARLGESYFRISSEDFQQTADGGFVIVGTMFTSALTESMWLAKLGPSQDGLAPQLEWARSYSGRDRGYGHSVAQTGDGGYVLTGSTFLNSGTYERDTHVVKVDANGNPEWNRVYPVVGVEDSPVRVLPSFDGGYVVAANVNESLEYWHIRLLKLDAGGNVVWDRFISEVGAASTVWDLAKVHDGGYVMAARGVGGAGGNLVKTDALGNVVWTGAYGSALVDGYVITAQECTDGGFVGMGMGGYSGQRDFHLFKTDAIGSIAP